MHCGNVNKRRSDERKVKMSTQTPQFDANLSDILQNVRQIDNFLDVVFEFLYRRLVHSVIKWINTELHCVVPP